MTAVLTPAAQAAPPARRSKQRAVDIDQVGVALNVAQQAATQPRKQATQ